MSRLSEEIISLSARYLGPEAKRFLERQAIHIQGGKTLDKIEENDLGVFAWWVGVSAKLIMDKEKAKELSVKIASLRGKQPVQPDNQSFSALRSN